MIRTRTRLPHASGLFLNCNNQDLEGGIDMKQHFPDEAGFNDGTQVIPDSVQVEFGKNIS